MTDQITIDTALSRGFSAGNYANAYLTENYDQAWVRHEHAPQDPIECEAYRAAFVLGFFASYETREIERPRWIRDVRSARSKYGERMRAIGIAID